MPIWRVQVGDNIYRIESDEPPDEATALAAAEEFDRQKPAAATATAEVPPNIDTGSDWLGIGQEVRGVGRSLERGYHRAVQAENVQDILDSRAAQDFSKDAPSDIEIADLESQKNHIEYLYRNGELAPVDYARQRIELSRAISDAKLKVSIGRGSGKRRIESFKNISSRQKAIEAIPQTQAQEEFSRPETSALSFFKNPIELAATTTAESLPGMVKGMTGAIGGPLGLAVTTFATSGQAEAAARIINAMAEADVDIEDSDAIAKWFNDTSKSDPEVAKAIRASIGPALFDALTAGAGGVFLRSALGGGVKKVAGATAKEIGMQMAGGAAGSAAGSMLVDEPVDPKDILLEMAGELAPLEAGLNVRGELIRRRKLARQRASKGGETVESKEIETGVLQDEGMLTGEGVTEGQQKENRLITEDEAKARGPRGVIQIMENYNVDRPTAVEMQSRARQWYGISKEVGLSEEGLVPSEQAAPPDVTEGVADTTGGVPEGTVEPLRERPAGPPTKRQQALYDAMEMVFNAVYAGEKAPTREAIIGSVGIENFTKAQWAKIWSQAKRANTQLNNERQGMLTPAAEGQSAFAASQAKPTSGPLKASEILDQRELRQKIADGMELEPNEQERYDAYRERQEEQGRALYQARVNLENKLMPEHQAVVDEAAKETGVKVRIGRPDEFSGSKSGNRAVADTRNNEVVVSPDLSRLDLEGMTYEQATEATKSLIAHEANHLATPAGSGEIYWNSLSKFQKALAKRIANLPDGMSAEMMGREVISRHMQWLQGSTPVEVAMELNLTRFTKASLDTLDRIIQSIREAIGTKASQKQLDQLDVVQATIRNGIKLYDESQASANRREEPSEAAKKFIEAWNNDKATIANASMDPAAVTTMDLGMRLQSTADLDAMLELHRGNKKLREDIRSAGRKPTPEEFRKMLMTQFPREMVETATDVGSWSAANKTARERMGDRPLDWRKNPEVELWLRQHGEEMGIKIPDHELSANKRPQPPQDHPGFMHWTDRWFSDIIKMDTEDARREFDKLDEAVQQRLDAIDERILDLWENKAYDYLGGREDEFYQLDEKLESEFKDIDLQQQDMHDWFEKRFENKNREPGQSDLPFSANRRYGMTKRGQRHLEEKRKLEALRVQAAIKGERNPLATAHEPVTPEKLTTLTTKVLQGDEPTVDKIMAAIRMRHGPIGLDQVKDLVGDALANHLELANGAELERMVDQLKLRREVYGSYTSGMTADKFIKQSEKYVGKKEAERLGFQSTKVSREGRIADQPTSELTPEVMRARLGKRYDQMMRLADKVEVDAGRLRANLGTSAAEDAKIQFRVNQAKMRAAKLREDAAAMMATPEIGESVLRQQSTLFGDLDKSPEIKLGTGSKMSSEVTGSAQKMRARAMAAIFQRIMNGFEAERQPLKPKEVSPDDLAWAQEGANAISALDPADAPDVDAFGWVLTRGGRSNATTKTVIAGGRSVAKRKGSLETMSKRVTALHDQATGRIHLVTTYRTGAGDVRLVNPLGGTMALREMPKRYTPIYTMMLGRPLKGFHQIFDSRADFQKQFLDEALDRKHQSAISDEMSTSAVSQQLYEIPAGEGIEGEGGYVIGPNASLVRAYMDNALRYGSELTEAEARKAFIEFSQVHTEEDADALISGLRSRIDQRKLSPSDYLLISAIKKAARAVDERVGEGMSDAQKAQQTLKELHEIAINSKTERDFVTSAKTAFRKKPQGRAERPIAAGPTERPAVLTPPTGTIGRTRAGARELTMMDRVAPTVVRDPQGRQIFAPREAAPPADVVGGGLPNPLGRPRTENDRKRAERLARYAILREKQKVRTGRYNVKEPDIIAETPGPREPYSNPAAQAARVQREMDRLNEVKKAREKALAEKAKATPEEQRPQPVQTKFWPEPSANRRASKAAEAATDALRQFGSWYDEWMADRIARNGGPNAKAAAAGFNWITDRTKEAYGSLTPVLDQARRLAGRPGSGASWLHNIEKVTRYAAVSRTVKAIEGNIKIPKFAERLVKSARDANYAIGKLLEPVIEGFEAGGSFQRNLTALGYDIIRGGKGEPLWDRWIDGIVAANKDRLVMKKHAVDGYKHAVKVTRELVEEHFIKWKAMLDKPGEYSEAVEQINQDMRRIYPETVTHVKDATGWHEVIHANLFNYLEAAAQRAAHARAFREQFPNTPEGRKSLTDMVQAVSAELKPRHVDDLHALLRTSQGHPSDNYGKLGLFSTSNLGGQAFKIVNQTFGNLLAKAVLTAQVPTQFGESVTGSTPVFLGYDNYLEGIARVRQLYSEMELRGEVNRQMYDLSWDPTARVRSTARVATNVIARLFLEDRLNEFQEAVAASTANVVAEKIASGRLSKWELSVLPQTMHVMGFTRDDVKVMMEGRGSERQAELLGQFKRRAATFLTSGNRTLSEGSALGSKRWFNTLFRFQSYPMMKMNQFRRLAVNWAETMQTGTGDEKKAATRLMMRFFGGNAMQGALTAGMISLVLGGPQGWDIFKNEAWDDPLEFIFQSFMAAIGGPMYILTRGARDAGIMGMGEQMGRMVFPYSMAKEVLDAGNGFGRYSNKEGFDLVSEFIKSKTPGLRGAETAIALFGASMPDRDLDTAISALYKWRRKEKGFSRHDMFIREDETKKFRVKLAKAIDALSKGDDKFMDLLIDAAEAKTDVEMEKDMPNVRSMGLRGVAQSLNNRTLLKNVDGSPLSEEDKESLRRRIGDRAYQRLEDWDMMIKLAAKGIQVEPEP